MAYSPKNPNGQATMANSEPVVIASDQSALTVNLSATDNAVLDAIEADTTTIAGAVSGSEMQVDVVTSALPTGAATSANQSTIIGHVDGIEGLLTTIDADTGNLPTIETNTDFGTVTGGGTETGALRVTIANNSTGVVSVDDNGGALTVDGTVAATQSGTWNITNVSGTVSLPTGASTLTEQQSQTTHLSNIATSVGTLDNAISGSEMQVDVVGALPAGTNNIGDVDIASIAAGTNYIGKARLTDGTTDAEVVPLAGYNAQAVAIVDGSGDQITSFGGGTQYAVDTALGGTPTGTVALAKVDATLSALTPVDGDAESLRVDANGALHVNMSYALDSTNDSITIIPTSTSTGIGKLEDAAHSSGDLGVMALAVRRDTSAASSGTTGDYEPLSTDATGKLWVVGSAIEDAAETAGGVLLMAGSVRRDTAASSAGTTGDNATINTDSVGALWSRSTGELADDAAFTPATSRVFPVGYFADETSTDSVDEGDVGAPRMSLNRQQIVTVRPNASGEGLSVFRSLDLDESEEEVKASAAKLYGWYLFNAAASTRYVKFYNATAASVTVGSTTPVMTVPVPAGAGANVEYTNGIPFTTALTVAATTGVADADTGAPAANDVIVNIFYV